MKSRILLLSLLLSTTVLVRAQFTLHPGDVWTGSFSNMSVVALGVTEIPAGGYGQLGVRFGSFPSGTLRFETWAWPAGPTPVPDEPYGTPGASGTIVGTGQTGSVVNVVYWSGQKGTVRLTMLSGQCVISNVTCGLTTPAAVNRVNKYGRSLLLNPPPPRLTISRLPATVELSWWTNDTTGYVLESAGILATNQWSVVPSAPVVVSNRYVVNVATSGNAAYFRLRK